MLTRTIDKVIDSKYVMMGKYKIAQPIPVDGIKQVDPFLLLHHAGPTYQPPNSNGLNVEAHPHTGFQPVTFVFNGEVDIPFHLSDNKKARLNVIAGHFNEISGAANSITGITAFTGVMDKEGTFNLDFDQSLNVLIYLLNGQVIINEQAISDKQLVIFRQDGTNIKVKANTASKLLILAGKPIKEPVYHYGPFVLNSKDEIIEAIDDYESGRMGVLD